MGKRSIAMTVQMSNSIKIIRFLEVVILCSIWSTHFNYRHTTTTVAFTNISPMNTKNNPSILLESQRMRHFYPSLIPTTHLVSNVSTSRSNHNKRVCSSSSLNYRLHSEEDTDDTMMKLMTRTSPIFKKSDVKGNRISSNEENLKKLKKASGGINQQILFSIILNQVILLSLAILLRVVYVVSFGQYHDAGSILNMSGNTIPHSIEMRILEGVLGSIPCIALGASVERSDDRIFANANFSTIYMVMTLFGLRSTVSKAKIISPNVSAGYKLEKITSSTDVAIASIVISFITGFCEEVLFRSVITSVLYAYSDNIILSYLGQAMIFGLGHTSPKTSFQENAVVGGLQLCNGLWLGLLYFMSGSDVLPCIIAHTIYDFQTLLLTWLSANDQIEYAYYKSLDPIPLDTMSQVSAIEQRIGSRLSKPLLETCKKVFYTFDTDKNGTISKSEAQKGISYLGIEGYLIPPSQEAVDVLFERVLNDGERIIPKKKNEDGDHQLRFIDFIWLFLNMKTWEVSRG